MVSVLTAVLDDDFLTSERRQHVLEQVTAVIDSLEGASTDEVAEERYEQVAPRRSGQLALMAAMATLLGSLTVLVPTLLRSQVDLSVVVAVLGASVTLVAIVASLLRLRETQEEVSEARHLTAAERRRFEEEVAAAVRKAGLNPRPNAHTDFLVYSDGKPLAIEAKWWTDQLPPPVLTRAIQELEARARETGAENLLIVTPSDVSGNATTSDFSQIVPLKHLRRHLRERDQT